ncbi:hypothetical protein [Saccharomonospora piscinae]|nr:hypothetical protein [Saccharomonospora piscinae]
MFLIDWHRRAEDVEIPADTAARATSAGREKLSQVSGSLSR